MKSLIGAGWLVAVLGIGTGLVSASCGGQSSEGKLESESHFLATCTATCPSGLSCVNGVCTESCIIDEADTCGGLSEDAICTNESVEPGAVAVCDVPCEDTVSCSKITEFHRCVEGYCRGPQVDKDGDLYGVGTSGSGGADGGNQAEQGASEDTVDYVYVQPVDFPKGKDGFGCSIPPGLFDEEGGMHCTLVRAEDITAGLPNEQIGTPACNVPGRAPVSTELADAVRASMAGDSCDDAEGDCLDWALCEYVQIPAEEAAECWTGTANNALIEPTGFCGVDLDSGAPVHAELADRVGEACGDDRQVIRLTGGHTVEGSAITEIWMACTVEPDFTVEPN